jgi:tetratricopeptide (TPR) repeat protein
MPPLPLWPSPLAVALVLAQASAWTTGRPPECGDPGGRAENVWERAKSPELRRYCDLLASASSKLAGTTSMAEAALASAREADQVLPGHAGPHVLEGRALAALGKLDEASKALSEAKAREPTALDDPLALLAWARVLARTGHPDGAAEAYRMLLPRASAMSATERASASVEAGLVAIAQGVSTLDEAVAALREGLRDAQDETQAVAVLALAVALDRRGDTEESRALLAERGHGDPRTVLATARAKDLLAVAPGEASALAALALEPSDVADARDEWSKYIAAAGTSRGGAAAAGVSSAGLAQARSHLATLSGARGSGNGPR